MTASPSCPKGAKTEVYDDGKYYGKKIIYDDLPLTDFNTGEKGAPSITHANGKYVFTADLDTGADGLGPQAEMVKPFLSSLQITFAVTFPGKVVEHDAKAVVDGDTVRWNVALGGKNELRAVAEEGSAFPWLVVAVVGGVLGLAVIIGIVLLAVRLTRRKAPPPRPTRMPRAAFDPATVAQPVGGGAGDPSLRHAAAGRRAPPAVTARAGAAAARSRTPRSGAGARRGRRPVAGGMPREPGRRSPQAPRSWGT